MTRLAAALARLRDRAVGTADNGADLARAVAEPEPSSPGPDDAPGAFGAELTAILDAYPGATVELRAPTPIPDRPAPWVWALPLRPGRKPWRRPRPDVTLEGEARPGPDGPEPDADR